MLAKRILLLQLSSSVLAIDTFAKDIGLQKTLANQAKEGVGPYRKTYTRLYGH
jgi:hypothetical protein